MSFLMVSVANIFVGANLEFIVGISPLSLAKIKKKNILRLSHWPLKDFGLNVLHDVKRVLDQAPVTTPGRLD